MGSRFAVILLALLGACTTPGKSTDVMLLGEQHDAPLHQRLHRERIQALVARGTLTAVAIEMAEQGHSTAALPRDAGEDAVKAALGWREDGWPWLAYGPAIMVAVRAGVPVLGANLPRAAMRAAMSNEQLDASVPAAVLQAQRDAVREGHCGLMPEAQVTGMARIQLARDRAMAQALVGAARRGNTVVLLAGGAHVDRALGVPLHLPAALAVQVEQWPPQPPAQDYCAQLRERLRR